MTRRIGVAISLGDNVTLNLPAPIIDALTKQHPQVERDLRRWSALGHGQGRIVLLEPEIVAEALALLEQSSAR